MTPAARVQAAAEILDRIGAGAPAEQALTNWARGARYAGSKDRAAVRDHVFDVLRRWRSTAVAGGAATGRGRMLGLLRQTGGDVAALFSGEGHAPAPQSDEEAAAGAPATGPDALDLPDWLIPLFESSLGPGAPAVAEAMRHRAPAFLRVNLLRGDVPRAIASLAEDGIAVRAHPLAATALEVTEGARGIARSRAYETGLVELQDAASQAVVAALPLVHGMRVLDFCAGGGGKALAMAALLRGPVEAHDADPRRMSDLPARARRAGAVVEPVSAPRGQYDLVLCDVPCSGSGAWRRSPEGKWALDAARLDALRATQAAILDEVSTLVRPGGTLAYATCSVLTPENDAQIDAFLGRHGSWSDGARRRFLPGDGGDGFFLARLTR